MHSWVKRAERLFWFIVILAPSRRAQLQKLRGSSGTGNVDESPRPTCYRGFVGFGKLTPARIENEERGHE
jgi:hypothetical protein